MDPKSTAKSKRSHTQHGRRTHQSPAPIAQKNKATKSSSIPSLPSNWERYSKTDTDTEVQNKEAGHGDVVIKSKGADFGYLIEQAKSQPQDFTLSKYGSELDEASYDFMQGISSMLSVRGEGLLSFCRNDNFVVDDDLTSSNEVPILSMDLNVLAAQLSKLKLSQRLFIEEDLLPEELTVEEEYNTTSQSKEPEISEAAELECDSDSQLLHSQGLLEQNNVNVSPHKICASDQLNSQITSHEKSDTQMKPKTTIETAAETNLDVLLDSFNDVSLSNTKDNHTANENSDSWINAKTISIDDSIDDLLAETSLCSLESTQTVPLHKQASVTMNFHSDSASTNVKKESGNGLPAKDQHTNELNDFDSWLDSL